MKRFLLAFVLLPLCFQAQSQRYTTNFSGFYRASIAFLADSSYIYTEWNETKVWFKDEGVLQQKGDSWFLKSKKKTKRKHSSGKYVKLYQFSNTEISFQENKVIIPPCGEGMGEDCVYLLDTISFLPSPYQADRQFRFTYELMIDDTLRWFKQTNGMGVKSRADFLITNDSTETDLIEYFDIFLYQSSIKKKKEPGELYMGWSLSPNGSGSAGNTFANIAKEITFSAPEYYSGFMNFLASVPMPSVKTPLTKGSTWKSSRMVGPEFSADEWGQWEDSLLIDLAYNITGEDSLYAMDEFIKVYSIEATGKSRIGVSKAEFLYNLEYGFVRLHFTFFNGNTLKLELVLFTSGDTRY